MALRQSFDVVVIGAGVMGLHSAYQLACRAPDLRIKVLESAQGTGHGSSGFSSAFLRCLYSQPKTTEFACDGLKVHRNWEEYVEFQSDRPRFTNIPILWLNPQMEHKYRELQTILDKKELRNNIMRMGDIQSQYPMLSTCSVEFDASGDTDHECKYDLDVPVFCELDSGFGCPSSILSDLVEACRIKGVEVEFGQQVEDIKVSNGRVESVTTTSQTISTNCIVNAAGPWCNIINDLAGVQVPFTFIPTRIPVLYKNCPDFVPDSNDQIIPAMFDVPGGIYFRPQIKSRQLLVSTVREEEEKEEVDVTSNNFNDSLDPDVKQRLLNSIHHRIPELPASGTVTGFSAMYTITKEDVHPCIGATNIEGMFIANGFSGHGFKLSPMVGCLMAKLITNLDGPWDSTVETNYFSPYRKPLTMNSMSVIA